MAYVSNPKELDPNAPVQLSGAGTAPTGGSAGASSVVNRAPSASSGGGFTNVQAYLNSAANRQQGARMGQNLAADVTREVGEANSAITSGVNQFNTAADQNTVGYDEGQVDQTISTGAANPYTTRALAGTYTGPTGLSRAAIDKETSEATGRANLLQTQGGRAEYLRQLTGRNQSTGVSRLNNAFVNTNADAIGAINAGAAGARGLGDQVTAAEAAAATRAGVARDTNAATRGRVRGKIDSYLDTQEGDIEARTTARRSEAQARQAAAANYLRSLSGIVNFGNDGRARAGGSGGLVDTSTPEGRMRALDVPVTTTPEGRASIASAPAAPVEGRAQALRMTIGDGENGGRSRAGGGSGLYDPSTFVGPINPATAPVAPLPPIMSSTNSTDQAAGIPPSVSYGTPPAPLPLQGGFESTGLTEAQARQLQDIVESNNLIGADRLDLNTYYTPAEIANINSAQSLNPQEAARLNALAALTGRRGFTTAPQVDANGNFSFENALAALQSNNRSAINRNAARDAAFVGPRSPTTPPPVSTGTSPGGVPVVSVPGGGQPASAPVYPTTPVTDVVYDPNTGTPVSIGGVPITAAPNQGVPGGRTTSPNNGDDGRGDFRVSNPRPAPVTSSTNSDFVGPVNPITNYGGYRGNPPAVDNESFAGRIINRGNPVETEYVDNESFAGRIINRGTPAPAPVAPAPAPVQTNYGGYRGNPPAEDFDVVEDFGNRKFIPREQLPRQVQAPIPVQPPAPAPSSYVPVPGGMGPATPFVPAPANVSVVDLRNTDGRASIPRNIDGREGLVAPMVPPATSAPAPAPAPIDRVVDLITTPRVTIPRSPRTKFGNAQAMEMAEGGPIEGPGGPRDDMVPINASNGEYIIPSHVVEKLGKDFFDKMLSTYKR